MKFQPKLGVLTLSGLLMRGSLIVRGWLLEMSSYEELVLEFEDFECIVYRCLSFESISSPFTSYFISF